MRIGFAIAAAFAAMLAVAPPAAADEAAVKQTQETLLSGKLADGAAALQAMIDANGGNDEARYGLGMIEFVQAVEHLSQGLYRYGLQPPHSIVMPIVRLPVPENPNPEPIDYGKFRALLQRFVDDLTVTEKTLAAVKSADVKIPVTLATIHYDANGDGTVTEDEQFLTVLSAILDIDAEDLGHADSFVVAFDKADTYWFRGYANVLMALGEFLLAYDWHESFDDSFHVFFPKAHSPFQEALAPPGTGFITSETALADLISYLHIRWPVAEPARLRAVRDHLKAMIDLSRLDFEAIKAETDNDREWIPNPLQTAATGSTITAAQITAWYKVLDTYEALLDGKLLMPHWRMKQGVNLRRVFEEPQPFDLVLWITGPAALPYVEDGPMLTSEQWDAITSAFEDNFGSYAIWFN